MYVCINIEGQITKFIFFFLQKKNYGTLSFSKNGTKDCKRFKLYLYIKQGFWVGLAQLWFSSLYRIGKLWGVCVCAFVWKRVCVLENQLFVIYPICMVQNTGLSLSLLFLSGIGWGCALTWLVWRGSGIFSKFLLDVSCCKLFFSSVFFAACHVCHLQNTNNLFLKKPLNMYF